MEGLILAQEVTQPVAVGPILNKKKKKGIGDFFKRYAWLNLMLLPCVVYFLVFHYLPMYGILMAFKYYDGSGGFAGIWYSRWAGFAHFEAFFKGIFFWRLIRNTVVISGLRLIFVFPMPIIMALLINELRNLYFKRIVQTVTYMPHFLSWVIVASLLMIFLSPVGGPINAILARMGISPINFLSDNYWFRFVLIVSDIWKNIGYGSIVYLAAITGVDQEMYEAATIDGANKWQKTIYITIPSIKEIIAIMFILQVGRIMNDNFDQIFNLYNAAVYETGDIFDTYVYRAGINEQKYSLASAVGLFKSVISLGLVLLSNKVAHSLGSTGLW